MDDLDKAKVLEMTQRKIALNNQLQQAKETDPPLYIDGVRCCVDCGDAISQKRLTVRPESVRCMSCKTIKEEQQKRFKK